MSAPLKTATTPGAAAARAAVDLADDRVRVRRANDRAMQLAGNVDVGDKAPAAAQKPRILDAPDRCADAVVAP